MTFETPNPSWWAYATYALVVVVTSLVPLAWVRSKGWPYARRRSALVVLTLTSLVLPLVLVMTWNRVEVADGYVYIKAGGWYETGRSVGEFDLENARVGRYAELPDAALGWRQNGVAVPGFKAGHFSLQNGKPAFVLMTNDEHTLVLPAKVGPTVIVTVKDPAGMLRQLQAMHSQQSG